MATGTNFSVFPPPRVPRIAMPNPGIRKPSLKTVYQVDDGKSPVMIAMKEISVSDTQQEYTPRSLMHSPMSATQTITASPMFKNGIPPPPPPFPRSMGGPRHTPTASASNQSSPDPESISSSDTLVHSPPREDHVVPIRSMFPVYNPSVTLAQQNYYPNRPNSTYDPKHFAVGASPSPAFGASATRQNPTQRTNNDSIIDVPLDVLNFKEQVFSTTKELERLWNATSSSEPLATAASFDLEMGRLEEATFAFGSTADAPFYSVTTYDTAELSITKTCPRKMTVTCDVALAAVESGSRRLPPGDGLIAKIFPKLAAMLAITQTDALTAEYNLPSEDREELLEAAMQRASDQEVSHLRWNAMHNRYELEHPAILRKGRDTNFVTSPMSPQSTSKPAIHITVATFDESVSEKPIIIVTCPASVRAANVSSTGTENTGDIQLASLDFNTNTLHIEANNIIELVPSLFAVDSIFTAIAVVAIADEDANTAMGNMKIYAPKSGMPKRQSTFTSPANSPTTGTFYATIAERAEAEEDARVTARNYKKDKRTKVKMPKFSDVKEDEVDVETGRSWYGKSKTKKPKKTKQIVISEFDLEKLTHYQSGARQGQEIPAFTRGLLSMLVNSLKFVVWIQTAIVQFLCWLLVAMTRGVTSERF